MAKKILILEDDTILRKMYTDLLVNNGIEVYPSANYDEALKAINKNKIDLVLLDIMLPGGHNGFDFLEDLKRDPSKKDIKVIILTNLDSEEKVARSIGVDGYLVKSNTRPKQVLKMVSEILG